MGVMVCLNTVLCAALFWSCFCRVVRTDDDTEPAVRTAFCVLASVALAVGAAPFGVLAPLVPACEPPVAQLLLVAGMVLVQGLTARYWRHGVPAHFQRAPACGRGDEGGQQP